MIQLRLFNYKFRAPFTSSQPPSHDENLILCGIMGPKLANVRNIHFACSSSQYRFPFASQHNYLCICNSSFVSLCKKKKKKSEQILTLGIPVFSIVSAAQGLGASGRGTFAHWIRAEPSSTGWYPAFCNSYTIVPAWREVLNLIFTPVSLPKMLEVIHRSNPSVPDFADLPWKDQQVHTQKRTKEREGTGIL